MTQWVIVATDGIDDHLYVADDEQGTWAPATSGEVAAITSDEPLDEPLTEP